MQLKIKKTHKAAKTPTYGTPGSACFDIYAAAVDGANLIGSTCDHEKPVLCRTGLQFEIPTGHAMLVFSRSGMGFRDGIRLANCVGVIDSDYRGELLVKLTCDDSDELKPPAMISPGDRVAQAMVLPVEAVEFLEVETLSETERGDGGLGSTGVR